MRGCFGMISMSSFEVEEREGSGFLMEKTIIVCLVGGTRKVGR